MINFTSIKAFDFSSKKYMKYFKIIFPGFPSNKIDVMSAKLFG